MIEEQRIDHYNKAEKALKLYNQLSGEDLSNPDRRIELIKSMHFDTFFRILAFANGLLREGKPGKTTDVQEHMSVSMVGVSDFESSIEGRTHLQEAFNQFKTDLTPENLTHQAANCMLPLFLPIYSVMQMVDSQEQLTILLLREN